MRRDRVFGILLVAVMLASLAVPAMAAVSDDISFGGDSPAPNPYIDEDTLTKDHDMAWGTDAAAALQYEDDNGDTVSADASLNDSKDNQYRVTASHIDDPDWAEFPRKDDESSDNEASILDASEWTTSDITASDVQPADGVEGVQLDTNGSMGAGDSATATYSNFSITSDEEKRYITFVVDVTTLDSGATVYLNVTDTDGDYKSVKIDPDGTAGNSDVVENATADGAVLQTQLADLTTEGTGDGDFNDIESVEYKVVDADATLEVAYIDLAKKGEITFGEEKKDTDSDDELETVEITEPSGEYKVHDLSTLDSTLDNAELVDMKVEGVKWQASDLTSSDDYQVSFSNAEQYPGYDKILEVHYRIQTPAQIDLSHSGLDLMQHTEYPGARYVTVETKEGVSDTDFDDIDNWNDQTGSFDAADKNVTLDSTVSSDTEYAVHIEMKLTQSEVDAMQAAGTAGGGGLFASSGGGGVVGFMTSLPGMLVGAGALLVQRIRNGIPFSWF